jgi:hypothetical protein
MIQYDNLNGTCAFAATCLAGVPVQVLHDAGQPRAFGVVWLTDQLCCVWDEQRGSYLHIHSLGDHWRAYDVASGHELRIDRAGDQFTFTDAMAPFWFERVGIGPHEAHCSGTDGECCYEFELQHQRGELLVAA